MEDEDLVIVFIPSLSALLLNREKAKGSPLTEVEVLAIRDGASVVEMPADKVHVMDETRGYRDIDPENCWEEWQQLRRQFQEPGPG